MATLPAIKQEQAVNERLALCLELSSNNSDGSHYKRSDDTNEYTEQVKACSTQKQEKEEKLQEKVEPVEESHVEEPDFREESPAGWRYEDMSNEVQVTVAKQTKPATFFVRSLNHGGSFDGPESGPTHCRQFWRAGDYEGQPTEVRQQSGGIDHVRVHPKFLHSNATSHKWALGAIAEILDNAMDEVRNGATFVNVDMVRDPRDGVPMLYIEDDGGGMTPERMRECMSLGFSTKSNSTNTIGQYGNGFKTSTMRLGADVIVFSRSPADVGRRATQSIGMLSFTFLRSTGHDDIVVPMVDYELEGGEVWPLIRTTRDDWAHNLETIHHWSPYGTENDFINQFCGMKEKGTKIIVYSLWEDDQGQLELDFDTNPYDIQVRGTNRDEKKIMMAQRYPNSRHFLTYRYSLRSYVSILYLRLPPGFRIILRGVDIRHHSLVDDLMFTQELSYKPQGFESSKDVNMVAMVTLGFVKDAKDHVDIQGFNVYHKNRLIKPFWRVWNTAGSDGRGIIGVLEANFVEPAHDKQSFERTAVLSRLELRLLQMQKLYWSNNCHLVGYVNKKLNRKNQRQSASGLDFSLCPGNAQASMFATAEPLSEAMQLSTPRLSVGDTRSDVPKPTIHLVFTKRFSTKSGRGVGRGEVARSASVHKEVFAASQGLDSSVQEPASNRRNLEELGRLLNSYKNLGSQYARSVEAEETVHGQSTTENGQRSPFNSEITQELEENKQLRDRLRRLEQADEQTMSLEVDRNRKLEAKLLDMEQQEAVDRRCLEQYSRERDSLRAALEEERCVHESDDVEMRKKLKVALLRVRELEAENNRLRLPRG